MPVPNTMLVALQPGHEGRSRQVTSVQCEAFESDRV